MTAIPPLAEAAVGRKLRPLTGAAMSRQYNKIEKRHRRERRIDRLKDKAKAAKSAKAAK
jgi:hypothetical protein